MRLCKQLLTEKIQFYERKMHDVGLTRKENEIFEDAKKEIIVIESINEASFDLSELSENELKDVFKNSDLYILNKNVFNGLCKSSEKLEKIKNILF